MCGPGCGGRTYGIVPHVGPSGGGTPVVTVRPSCRTAVFAADAYGIVPYYLSVGTGVGFLSIAITGAFEAVFNCRDGSAHLFFSVTGGMGMGFAEETIPVAFTAGFGVNMIYDLATASAYAGIFVGVTVSAVALVGVYGTAFTTARGRANLVRSGFRTFGGETYGFGLGLAFGTPSMSLTQNVQYSWDLGSIAQFWTPRLRALVCDCGGGRAPNRRLDSDREDELRELAEQVAAPHREPMRERIISALPPEYVLAGAPDAVRGAGWRSGE